MLTRSSSPPSSKASLRDFCHMGGVLSDNRKGTAAGWEILCDRQKYIREGEHSSHLYQQYRERDLDPRGNHYTQNDLGSNLEEESLVRTDISKAGWMLGLKCGWMDGRGEVTLIELHSCLGHPKGLCHHWRTHVSPFRLSS